MATTEKNNGYFGNFGGKFIPETLSHALKELESAYNHSKQDKQFKTKLKFYLEQFAGRPTPLYYAARLSDHLGVKVYLKREDLLHTGAHKINNTLGQVLLAVNMKKKRIIAETGAGQHGVATAVAAARFGLECEVFMGEEDMERQALNVFRMRLMGAKVTGVSSGSKTLKDATNEAMRNWVATVEDTHYIIGSVVGPHPFPTIVRDFQSIISKEARQQILKQEKKLPDYVVACVGGGSNAIGMFHNFYNDKSVKLVGVEAAGLGLNTDKHSASLCKGSVGVLHGSKSYLLQTDDGQIKIAHSVSAGLDYPGVGPEHAFYKQSKRAQYVSATDVQALKALKLLSELEGIIPALESSHALAYLITAAKKATKNTVFVVCLSGRGDKDMEMVSKIKGFAHNE